MLGVGVDLVNLQHMQETLDRSGDVFLQRVYSKAEIERGRQCASPVMFFASAFAVKEAVFKALTLHWQAGIDFRDISVGRGAAGEPYITLSGLIADLAARKGGYECSVSISYETTMAIAMVVFQFK